MPKRIGLLLAIAWIGGLVVCARSPERELTAAQQALEQARAVGADVYAPDTFREAQDSLASARSHIETESEKPLFSRSYDDATELLTSAKHAANRAFYEANNARQEARESARDAIQTARTALERAAGLVGRLRQDRRTENDVEALKSELRTLEARLADAERDLEMGSYRGARANAESVVAQARIIEQDVARAREQST